MKRPLSGILVWFVAAMTVAHCVAQIRTLSAASVGVQAYAADAPDDPSYLALPPQHAVWPGVVVIVIIALFVTAALVGPIIRANNRDELAESENGKS